MQKIIKVDQEAIYCDNCDEETSRGYNHKNGDPDLCKDCENVASLVKDAFKYSVEDKLNEYINYLTERMEDFKKAYSKQVEEELLTMLKNTKASKRD